MFADRPNLKHAIQKAGSCPGWCTADGERVENWLEGRGVRNVQRVMNAKTSFRKVRGLSQYALLRTG